MLGYSQLNRLMKLHSPLGPDVLLLSGLEGRESVNCLYRFELELLALPVVDVPFDKILGQPVAVEIALPNGVGRYFHGIVSRFSQTGRDDTFAHYRAEIVPKFWLWTKRTQSRIFQQKTVPEILTEVLDGLELSLELTGNYQARDYCVQYRETDFAFASRLMEEEGICYLFEHRAEGHKMVLVDNPQQLPELPAPTSVVYDDVGEGVREDVRVQSWEKSQQLCTTKHTLWDHCFELPGQNLAASRTIQETAQVGTVEHKLQVLEETLEAYDYPGGYAQRFDGVDPGGGDRAADLPKIFEDNKRTVQLRQEEEGARSIRIEGRGNCAHFTPGYRFQLARHFNADGPYLITGVEHVARLNAGFRSGEESGEMEYHNTFTCVPESIPYRPPRVTSKPLIAGVQTATVVGPPGQHIFVDKYGRVKVQFHWDRQGKKDADSSCWIRVGQSWAGQRWGTFFWPRIGHEVIVTFAEGDPDQPIITGSVYNAANMPPLSLPEHAPAGGIKSCSVGGDPSDKYNAVVFQDQPDDEHVHIHSQTHEVITSEASKFQRTPGPQIQILGTLPFGAGSGGGGGGADDAGEITSDVIVPQLEVGEGSGTGGGILDWAVGLPSVFGASYAKKVMSLFPRSTTHVAGTRLDGTLLGDSIIHVLGGNEVKCIFDPEAVLADKIGGIGLVTALGGAAVSGVGGQNLLVCGPRTTMVYAGTRLSVTRGETLTYKSKKFKSNLVAYLASLLIAGTILAMDIVAYLLGKPKDRKAEGECPEWATLASVAVPSRLLALLTVYETRNAKAQAVAERAEETRRITNIARENARNAYLLAGDLLRSAEHRLGYAIEARRRDANQTNKILDEPYSLTATDISLTSRATLPNALADTSIHLSALGGGDAANNGSVLIDATKQVSINAGSSTEVAVEKGEADGHIIIGNYIPGDITIYQGPELVGPPEIKLTGEPPSIKLSVGAPDVGASIKLTMEGLFLQFGLWKLSITEAGISMSVAECNLDVTEAAIYAEAGEAEWTLAPAAWLVEAPVVDLNAETICNCEGGTILLEATELASVEGPVVMIN